tara:strand:+ start:2170 stop:2451 length:282 start_codon:yes stop_codon:yes gene_type:complete
MDNKENIFLQKNDTIVSSVIQKYLERSRIGKEKYGTTLDREDLDKIQWLVHLQEELMDATLYIEKLKKELENCKKEDKKYKKEDKNNNECIIS